MSDLAIEEILNRAREHQLTFHWVNGKAVMRSRKVPPAELLADIKAHRDAIIAFIRQPQYRAFHFNLDGQTIIALRPEGKPTEWMTRHLEQKFGADRVSRVVPLLKLTE